MRDDIHRRLPLPRRWKSLVRVAPREAERPSWGKHARNAAAFELAQLSPALLAAAMRSAAQPNLLGGVDPRLQELAISPIDDDFIRELAVAPQREPREAVRHSLRNAVESRVAAQLRSVRAHAVRESPKDAELLHNRLSAVFRSVDIDELVSRCMDGQRPLAAPPSSRVPFDFEIDIRLGLQ